jgi:hypothetical protein
MTPQTVGHLLDATKIPICTKRALGIIVYATIHVIEFIVHPMEDIQARGLNALVSPESPQRTARLRALDLT